MLDSREDCPLQDDGERRDMLAEMSRTLKRGSSSWQNPFGGDDKELETLKTLNRDQLRFPVQFPILEV